MLDALELARVSGWLALSALALALCATPVRRVLRRIRADHPLAARAPAWRRRFGITAAVLALLHGGIAMGGYLDDARSAVLSWPHLRAGLVAACILTALLVSSFPAAVRALRIRLWKPLHRLAYVAALLVLQHLLLSPLAPRAVTLGLFGALLVIGLLRWLPARATAEVRRKR